MKQNRFAWFIAGAILGAIVYAHVTGDIDVFDTLAQALESL